MKKDSLVGTVKPGELMLLTMFNATTESAFTLVRGVPSNKFAKIDDYYWTDVVMEGKPVVLSLAGNNPLVIDGDVMPGTYKLLNNGFEDEQAIVDMTLEKKRG